MCVHLIGFRPGVFGHSKTGMVKYGKTASKFLLITSDITGVALMTLEAAIVTMHIHLIDYLVCLHVQLRLNPIFGRDRFH